MSNINNTFYGEGAFDDNLTGSNNTALGAYSLRNNETGYNNTSTGTNSLLYNTQGSFNTAYGCAALLNNQDGDNNTAIGCNSLQNVSGNCNTALGVLSGFNSEGNYNTFIGVNTDISQNNYNYSSAVGAYSQITADNQIVLGGIIPGETTNPPNVYIPGTYLGVGVYDPSNIIYGPGLGVYDTIGLEVSGAIFSTDVYLGGCSGTNDFSARPLAIGHVTFQDTLDRNCALLQDVCGNTVVNCSVNRSILFDEGGTGNVDGRNISGYFQNNILNINNLKILGASSDLHSDPSYSLDVSGETIIRGSITSYYLLPTGIINRGPYYGSTDGSNLVLINTALTYDILDNAALVQNISGATILNSVSSEPILFTRGGRSGLVGQFTINGDFSTNNIISNGQVTANSFNTTSDYRIKENVQSLKNNSIYTIDGLNPVSYYNTICNKDDIGFIAHELQEQFPQLVNNNKDGEEYQSINYTGLIPILVKEIQELKHKILSLEISLNF
jgi:hypothetical protein